MKVGSNTFKHYRDTGMQNGDYATKNSWQSLIIGLHNCVHITVYHLDSWFKSYAHFY